MVHLRGHEKRGLGTRDWGLGRATVALFAALGAFMLSTAPAHAQPSIGFHGGFTVEPEQVFGGVFLQTGDVGRGIRLRPGIDGATGDGFRIANISMDLVYGYPLGANGWTFLAGGGPAVVITRFAGVDGRDTGVGFSSLVGFGHDSGFFVEVRLGSGRTQQLKVAAGWAIRLD